MKNLQQALAHGLDELSLSYDPNQLDRLLKFQALLEKWNKVYNLTALHEPEKILSLHVLDSLTVLPYLNGQHILDAGTGAGLPGIPLAVMSPQRAFFLLDGNAKKIRFVQQAAIELKLANVRVVQARLESFNPGQKFSTILARAIATAPSMLVQARRLLAANGVILLFKGRFPVEEIEQLKELDPEVIPLRIPGVDAQRHVIRIKASA